MQRLTLAQRPTRRLAKEHFRLEEIAPPRADDAFLLLRTCFMSVDPYMRTRMQPEGYDYLPHWQAGSLLSGYAIAKVEESRLPGWSRGDWAVGHLPMQEWVAHEGDGLRHAPPGAPPLSWLHPLGMTGFTAWLGMRLLGKPGPADSVLVGAAAGAVGSIAAQLAREAGARLIVTAGRKDKRDWLRGIGFECVLDHRAPDFDAQLQRAAPEGLTLDFETIGGTSFAAAIEAMRPGGRVIVCGLISQYQQETPRRAPPNLNRLGERGVAVIPFVAPHYEAHFETFLEEMTPRVTSGRLHWRLDMVQGGLAAVPGALVGLFDGDNLGKRIIAL
ncbi:NADP-dependent oxidoreductase [Litchfieldella qijiaojingensis]|uniref:NADP-dependent oxidoreductase n=1 Tax=Litchfieldella qijiaojingensis TaxID=980347 RepID=A0ABQ2Z1J5_9GAMM|nr:NADP-dependent oxidoreductase [Halomonas qijiaojingensis]GGX99413.1 NADP-dependent oxidoreductase [Halomonas qijiaojingensis]